jgi:hypothetical protein
MRAETVHVTDHALLRWKERASKTGEVNVQEIIQAVKESRVIKKNEPLPYLLPRLDGSVYSFNAGVLFILESVTIDEYRLVTVIADEPTYRGIARPPKTTSNPRKRQKYAEAQKMEIDIPSFDSFVEERQWLTDEKRRLERELATTQKKSSSRKELLKIWGEIEARLTENKPQYVEERDRQNEEHQKKKKSEEGYIDYGSLLLQILRELKELRSENRELRSLIERSNGQQPKSPFHIQPSIAGGCDSISVFASSSDQEALPLEVFLPKMGMMGNE